MAAFFQRLQSHRAIDLFEKFSLHGLGLLLAFSLLTFGGELEMHHPPAAASTTHSSRAAGWRDRSGNNLNSDWDTVSHHGDWGFLFRTVSAALAHE